MNKSENLILRVSPKLKKLVVKNAETYDMSPSELVRGLLLTAFVKGKENQMLKSHLLEKARGLTVEGKQLAKKKNNAEIERYYLAFSKVRIETLEYLAEGKGTKALNKFAMNFRIFEQIEELLLE